MPKISIILTVYNTAPYLEKCINSILSQDFEDFELIAVDNHSTDGSDRILKKYSKKDTRVKYHITDKHLRACASRDMGLRLAIGEYLTYVDSDDSVKPGIYNALYSKIKEHNADVAVCNYDLVYDDFVEPSYSNMENEVIDINDYTNYFFRYFCMKRPNNYLWTRLFKLSIIRENQLSIHPVDISEDTIFTMFYTMFSKRAVHIKDSYYNYFQRNNSTVRNTVRSVNIAESFVYAFDTVYDYARKFDLIKNMEDILPFYAYTRMRSIVFYSMQSGFDENETFLLLKNAINNRTIKVYLKKSLEHLEEYKKIQSISNEELESIRIFVEKCLK